MKKRWRRSAAILAVLSLLTAQLPPVQAAAPGGAAARSLYELGLFKGVGTRQDGSPDFALERIPTRGEGVTMLVRLLGGEAEAQTGTYGHPFTDVASWADPYVGYAYAHSISKGTSDTTFGTSVSIDRNQFLTLLLRSMGYSEVDWRDPTPIADRIGLAYPGTGSFCRGHVAEICLDALDCPASSGITLREQLVRQGVLAPEETVTPAPVEPEPVRPESGNSFAAASREEMLPGLARLTAERWPEFLIQVPEGREEEFADYVGACSHEIADANHWSMGWVPGSGILKVTPTYHDSVRILASLAGKALPAGPDDQAVLAAAETLCGTLLTDGMSDGEKVRALHDGLIDRTEYSDAGARAHDAAGPLLDGSGVCEGYSCAFQLLCGLSGVPCIRVAGSADGGSHSWNKVRVDGSWYNVDVTWDDPVSSRPILRHDYFLISDDTLSADHQWIQRDFLPVAESDYPCP